MNLEKEFGKLVKDMMSRVKKEEPPMETPPNTPKSATEDTPEPTQGRVIEFAAMPGTQRKPDTPDPETFGDFKIKQDGVYFNSPKEGEMKVCDELRVEAETTNRFGVYGKLLCFKPRNKGEYVQFYMRSDQKVAAVIQALRGAGLTTTGRGASHLPHFLNELKSSIEKKITSQPGWFEKSFVLPGVTFGDQSIVFWKDPDYRVHPFLQSGTFEQWKEHVASLAVNNPYLIFALSIGLAAPLMRLCNVAGGGFHVVGPEGGEGKSSLLEFAASVYGNPTEGTNDRYMSRFDATKAGTERTAASLNDCLFCCDELGSMIAKELLNTIQMVADGAGKNRQLPETVAYRVMILTSGNVSIEEHAATVGMKSGSAHERRLLQLTFDRLFNDTRGMTPGNFADHMREMASKYHGTAFPAWLEYIVQNVDQVKKDALEIRERFKSDVLKGAGESGMTTNAASRFGLCAAAGVLAARAGITGLTEESAYDATMVLWKRWEEHAQRLDPVRSSLVGARAFLSAYEGKLVNVATHPRRLSKVGYIKDDCFLIHPAFFREHFGKDYETVLLHLQSKNFLDAPDERHLRKRVRIKAEQEKAKRERSKQEKSKQNKPTKENGTWLYAIKTSIKG